MSSEPAPLAIEDLRELWRRLSRQHITLGASCTCAIGLSISIEDFEQDICDFLEADATRAGRMDVVDALNRLRPAGQNEPLTLLQLMDGLVLHGDASLLAFLTPRLNVSLGSIETAHRRMSFRCS